MNGNILLLWLFAEQKETEKYETLRKDKTKAEFGCLLSFPGMKFPHHSLSFQDSLTMT